MSAANNVFDVMVVGAGIGGISAAVASARAGARVLLLEAASDIGGTGVHSAVGLVCNFRDAQDRPITVGLHREFFPHVYAGQIPRNQSPDFAWQGERLETYDHRDLHRRYRTAINAEQRLTTRCDAPVTRVEVADGRIVAVETRDGQSYRASVFIDSSAEGHLSALAGCPFQLGRTSDGSLMPATLTFGLRDIDFTLVESVSWPTDRLPTWTEMTAFNAEMTQYLRADIAAGRAQVIKNEIFGVPYPDGSGLLFNTTRVLGVDSTKPESIARARVEADAQVKAVLAAIRQHPACAQASVDFISTKLGVREGRRVVGDYILTEEDCLGCARFDDMVAACAYMIDIHNPTGAGSRLVPIPDSGYYHIPYRSLCAQGVSNLLLGSRCISGTHEAHSSYRVMAPLSAIGQAAGVAACLSAERGGAIRDVSADEIRWMLRDQDQFIEGACARPARAVASAG
jgi:hypothetical protein